MDAVAATASRDLVFEGVACQAALVRTKQVSARELVAATLDQIAHLDQRLNAFRVVFAERALAEADRVVTHRGATDELPLLGVPIAIKDDQAVAGTPLVWGSNAHGPAETEDCELVRRLRTAGAIIVGVTRTPELTAWPFTETAAGGITRNPWDPQHTPGGSSGGSAAAVAAGMVAGATASDGAGSIRVPAGCCGLFGLKPQRDRVPLAPRLESWHGLSVPGFITRSVIDSALLYQTVTGEPYVAAAERDPGRLRIALTTKVPPPLIAPLNPEWRAAAEQTADVLRELGHDVVLRDPDYGLASTAVIVRYLAGVRTAAAEMAYPDRLERRTKALVRGGRIVAPLLARVRAHEAADAARINAIFDDVDIVLSPTMAAPPLPIGRYEGRGALWTFNGVARFMPFTAAWNHIGNPAAAVPAGLDSAGLPLSVQIAGRPDGEATLFALARQIETARPWSQLRPPIS